MDKPLHTNSAEHDGSVPLEERLAAMGCSLRAAAEPSTEQVPLVVMEIVRLRAEIRSLARWTKGLAASSVVAIILLGVFVFTRGSLSPRAPSDDIPGHREPSSVSTGRNAATNPPATATSLPYPTQGPAPATNLPEPPVRAQDARDPEHIRAIIEDRQP